MEMNAISKKEYERLKSLGEQVDWEAVQRVEQSLKDYENGDYELV